MAWTAPMTAVAGNIFTAAEFNTHVRDNFLETAPAKATTAGSHFAATGLNSIAERFPSSASIVTNETTTSTTYTDLATVGPTVTVATGPRAWVALGAELGNSVSLTASVRIALQISGATSVAASDDFAFGSNGWNATNHRNVGITGGVFTGLTAGTNTFTAKYRVSAGTGNYARRILSVIPF